jgi:hypothetical protein
MKKVSALALALAAVLCAAPRAAAQEPAPAQAAAARPEPTAEQRAAALELLEALDVAGTLEASINTMMEIQMQTNPAVRSVESVIREFFRRHISWNALKGGYTDLYARTFTASELREMTAFYRTPTGRKLARAMPHLMREGAALGDRAVQEHSEELRRMILEHLNTRAPLPSQQGRPAEPNQPNRPGQPNPPVQPNRPGQPNPPIQPERP